MLLNAAGTAAAAVAVKSAAAATGQYGIPVVAVAPGPIDTPMLRRADPDGKIVDRVPLHRIGSGEDIANAVLWQAAMQLRMFRVRY